MEKIRFILFLFFICFACSLQAQWSQITFEKYYDYGFAEAGNAVQQTTDGGYIIFGRQGISLFVSKILLVKTDSLGVEQWHKLIGNNNVDNYAYSGQQTSDGGYIMTGFTSVAGHGANIYLVKTDANGDTLWTKNYGGTDYDQGWFVQQTTDGGYVVAGETVDVVDSSYNGILLKTDMNGDTLWTKKYISTNADDGIFYSAQQTPDGGYIAAGVSYFPWSTRNDVYLVKTNTNGDTLWTKSIDIKNYSDVGRAVRYTPDGGYIVCGAVWNGNTNDMLWLKTNNVGDTLWTRTFLDGGHDNFLTAVSPVGNNGYIFTGSVNTNSPGYDIILIRTDINGDILWTKKFGSALSESAGWSDGAVIQTLDGGFAMVGGSDSGNASVYLIKTDSLGFVSSVIPNLFPKGISFSVFPNPFFENATLSISDDVKSLPDLSYIIYDLRGRKVQKTFLERGKNKHHISVINITSGIYLMQLLSNNSSLGAIKIIIH